jgi:ABC-2 type transport system permease protein
LLAWIPLTAPVAMPVLFAVGEAGIAEVAASAGITLVSTVIAFQVATLIYRRSILKMGGRVKLREVFSTGD